LVKNQPKRNKTLDILKGILIILSCCEHFSEHINNFFFDSANAGQITNIFQRPTTVPVHKFYLQSLGQFIYRDKVQQFFHTLLIPWVTHLYIAIAGFNLAKYDFKNDHKLYYKKLKLFGPLFCVFFIESFLVSSNFGFALSIHPIQI
jgi:hypothetical protein